MVIEEILRQIGMHILLMYATIGVGALVAIIAANFVVTLEERDKSKRVACRKEAV